MKKKLLFVVIGMVALLLSGCDKKQTLVCTNSQDSTGMKINTEATTKFVNDKVDVMNMKMEVVLDKSYEQYVDTIKDNIENQYKAYKKEKGFGYSISSKDNVITFTMTLEGSKASDDLKSKLGFNGSEKYSDNKKSLESQGYKCK